MKNHQLQIKQKNNDDIKLKKIKEEEKKEKEELKKRIL